MTMRNFGSYPQLRYLIERGRDFLRTDGPPTYLEGLLDNRKAYRQRLAWVLAHRRQSIRAFVGLIDAHGRWLRKRLIFERPAVVR